MKDLYDIKPEETASSLKRWIEGGRNGETNWCDWDLPLHWGGMSDPFQPIERKLKISLECLKVFAETKYPFIVSTKGTTLLTEPEYLDLLKECNVVTQVSMVSPSYDRSEPGAPAFSKRLEALPDLAANSKRLIIRAQPYVTEAKMDIIRALPEYKNSGVYGIVAEGLKTLKKRPGFVKMGADWVYDEAILRRDFRDIKAACHAIGLKFYCGENRLRSMGDALCCCGIEGLEGFRPNIANLNHYLFDEGIEYTPGQMKPNTGNAFRTLNQTTVASRIIRVKSYAENMEEIKKDPLYLAVMGVRLEKKD
jgi:DNA repair photolyase